MKKLAPPLLTAALCCRLAANSADGLPDFSNLTLQELAAVKITSVSKNQQSLSQVAAAVYVITQEDIYRSGMTDVADVLRLAPGVSVARLDGSKWAVSARGFNGRFADKLLVLIDGRSIYSAVFSGVYWDMSMPLLDDIDRIEVIRGPGASVWGADAVSGVINIITKSAGQLKGGSVMAGAGTSERGFGQVRFGGVMADGIDYRGYVSGNNTAASPLAGGQTAHDGWSDAQGGFRLDKSTGHGSWMLEGDLFENWRQETGILPLPQANYSNTPVNVENQGSSSSLAFEWRRRVGESSELRVTSSFSFISRPEYGLPVEGTRTGDLEVQYRFVPAKHHQLTVGLSDRLTHVDTPASGPVAFDHAELTYQTASGFAQDEVHLLHDRMVLTAGSILQHDLFGGWQLQPTARALWAPNKHHSVWVSASRAVRTPTLYERDINAQFASYPGTPASFGLTEVGTNLGSPQFQAESLRAAEVGYRAQPALRFSIDITAFFDDYHHLASVDQDTPYVAGGLLPYVLLPGYFSNRVNALAPGGEISVMYHPVTRWKLAGSYSYLNEHSQFAPNTPASTFSVSPNAYPTNQWKVQSYLNLWKNVQFDAFLFSWSSVESVIYPFSQELLPPHTRLDARLGWRLSPRLELSLSAQDLLEPRHIELLPEILSTTGYAVRGYYVKTSWSF